MRRIVTVILVLSSLLGASPSRIPAQPASVSGREALARALAGAWLPLESGLVLGSTQGTPLSAKYEIEDGPLQLSVYTLKGDPSSVGQFSEVIVDYSAGLIAQIDPLTDADDVSAAENQKAAMLVAKRSLATVTKDAVDANPGYRAVSAMPRLDGGRPVVDVTLLRGTDWKVVTQSLD